jgi:hypothetical protein
MVCTALNCDAWNHDGLNLPFSPSWFELRFKLQILSLLLPLRADVLTANVSAEGRDQKFLFSSSPKNRLYLNKFRTVSHEA